MNNIPYVTVKNIASPVTGSLSKPQIKSYESGGKIYEEAYWYCPDSGKFITKGIVSVKDKSVRSAHRRPEENT